MIINHNTPGTYVNTCIKNNSGIHKIVKEKCLYQKRVNGNENNLVRILLHTIIQHINRSESY